MEPTPFNRRQWASLSLRVTAKELSLVNKNNSSAIVEIFSKYQKAAEEANMEKKRSNAENLPQHFRRGNLTALRKKWENPVLGADSLPDSVRNSSAEVRHRGDPPPAEVVGSSASGVQADREELVQPRPKIRSPPEAPTKYPHPRIKDSEHLKDHSTENKKMENCLGESRHEVAKPEMSENAETANKIEKYNVPLNRLKMMFEKGEPTQTKIPRGQSRSAGGRKMSENSYSLDDLEIGPGQLSSSALNSEKRESRRNLEFPRLSETSIKDRMAKYQAAVSKQSSSSSYTVRVRHHSFIHSSSKWSLTMGTRNVSHTLTCEPWLLPGIQPFSLHINPTLASFVEKAMAPHSSTLAWRIPWTEEPGRLQSMGSRRVGHD